MPLLLYYRPNTSMLASTTAEQSKKRIMIGARQENASTPVLKTKYNYACKIYNVNTTADACKKNYDWCWTGEW